jgi:DNA-binding transcriptional regulator YdaS (Cro superfamily)
LYKSAVNVGVQKAADLVGGQTALANLCGVKQAHVWKWLRMERIPAERAIQIELVTEGRVTRQDLRPDIFGAPKTKARKKAA